METQTTLANDNWRAEQPDNIHVVVQTPTGPVTAMSTKQRNVAERFKKYLQVYTHRPTGQELDDDHIEVEECDPEDAPQRFNSVLGDGINAVYRNAISDARASVL